MNRKIPNDVPELEDESFEPTPKPSRRPRRQATFGASAWYYLGWLWQVFLLALVLAIIATVIWVIGAVLPHLPSLAHSTVGHWIMVASRWESHWFARVPVPTKRS